MRLIDADVLRTSIEKDRDASDMPKMWYEGIEYAINHIIHAPTADVPERNVGKWIPVTERLPEAGIRYQVTFESGEVGYADFRNKIFFYDGSAKENVWEIERYYEDDGEVIAWMPRPEPYRKEADHAQLD